jgi:hypothetical protein
MDWSTVPVDLVRRVSWADVSAKLRRVLGRHQKQPFRDLRGNGQGSVLAVSRVTVERQRVSVILSNSAETAILVHGIAVTGSAQGATVFRPPVRILPSSSVSTVLEKTRLCRRSQPAIYVQIYFRIGAKLDRISVQVAQPRQMLAE